MGAQGLMQVMTRVHDDKYTAFGGTHAAFDPISNLRVGVQVLKECIARAGSVREGLRYYVGAALQETDGGYAARVMIEQAHMRKRGRRPPGAGECQQHAAARGQGAGSQPAGGAACRRARHRGHRRARRRAGRPAAALSRR